MSAKMKVVVLLCFCTLTSGATVDYKQLFVDYEKSHSIYPETTVHPKYQFEYMVKDEYTGDIKDHKEEGQGDVVKGSYSLVEADGTLRTVHYHDDGHSGFNALVIKSSYAHHPPPQKQQHTNKAAQTQRFSKNIPFGSIKNLAGVPN